MIELVECAGGLWTWRWVDDGPPIWSSKTYPSRQEATESATRAYPGVKVVMAGRREPAATGAPEPAETPVRRPGRPLTGSRSRLISLVVLLLTYRRTRRSSDGAGRPG